MHEWVMKGGHKTILTTLSHHKFPFRERTVLLTTATIAMDCLRRHRLLAVSKGSSVPARPLTLSLLHVVFVVLLLCPCVIVFVGGSSSETTACETRTVDSLPPPNFSKMDEIAQSTTRQMAHQLSEYLVSLADEAVPSRNPQIKIKAIEIARAALREQPEVLGAGIAAPVVPFAVVQFQSAVIRASEHWEESQTKSEFLAAYWRVMGGAWNRTGNTEQWGFPFRDCGPLRDRWLWPYTATVQVAKFKLVTALFVPADSDPCTQSEQLALEIYGRPHRHVCNAETETCTPVRAAPDSPSRGPDSFAARTDLFACDCRPGFVREDPHNQTTTTTATSSSRSSSSIDSPLGDCIACHLATTAAGMENCNHSSHNNNSGAYEVGAGHNANLELLLAEMEQVATLSLESLMNATIGAVLGSCIVTALGLAMIVYRKRKFKTIAMSMWTILETIIVGIVVMYSAVLLHFLEASTLRCLLEPWLRELGFVVCYGAITLKLYRHLIEFRTRKAHRCVVRDVDLLKYLCAMVVAVLCYLSAFTASSLDFVEHSHLRVENNLCRALKWDYVTEAGEMAILLFGLYLSYISRNAKTMFQERNFLVAAIIIEFVVSINFYIIRAIYVDQMSAPVLFLCLFVRSQLTNTVALGLVFLPKLLHSQKKGINESAFRSGTSAGPHLSAGDPDIGEVTLSEMNPEEIRKELKRLYTQLEILKNKTLRLDNPHISKRRGGRKTHRRFSLQKKGSKDKALHARNRAHVQHDAEITEAEPSRTPEDSVCSVEGPTEVAISK